MWLKIPLFVGQSEQFRHILGVHSFLSFTIISLTFVRISLIALWCFPDHFSQVEDDNGLLNFPKFEAYLRELLQVCLSLNLMRVILFNK